MYDETTITYVLPRPVPVVVEVYDLLGRRAVAHELGLRPAGRHTFDLDARTLPSGTYMYRLSAGEQHHTGHMSVLR